MARSKKLGVRPLGERVIVEAVEAEEMSPGGLMLPETARQKPDQALVTAVGKGDDMEVDVGDVIYLPPFCGTAIDVDGVVYRVVNYEDIIAVRL
tara:strand:+ start:160 stop:441 length:282 start_codon:yes stop_codon:yes gene_type:complete